MTRHYYHHHEAAHVRPWLAHSLCQECGRPVDGKQLIAGRLCQPCARLKAHLERRAER